MTTRIAIVLFALIIAAIIVDLYILDYGIAVETARKGIALLQQIAFWR